MFFYRLIASYVFSFGVILPMEVILTDLGIRGFFPTLGCALLGLLVCRLYTRSQNALFYVATVIANILWIAGFFFTHNHTLFVIYLIIYVIFVAIYQIVSWIMAIAMTRR